MIFVLNLLLTLHNIIRYLVRLRITKSLIVMFYVFVTINNIGNIAEFFLKASDPRRFWTDGDKDLVLKIFEQITLYVDILIWISLILTMQQLAVTLSQIVDQVGMERARFRNQAAKTTAAIAVIVYGPLELILPF